MWAKVFGERRGVAAGAAVCLLVWAGGCGRATPPLPGAVYAGQVPVYPGASYEDSIGEQSSDRAGGPTTAETTSWFFKVGDPVEKVTAFYRSRLPGARQGTDDLGGITFEIVPPEAEPGEYVRITVRSGELQIGESLRPGKKSKDSLL